MALQVQLHLRSSILRVLATLDEETLESNKSQVETMKGLGSGHAWFRLNPLEILRLVSQLATLSSESVMLARQLNWRNSPHLLVSGALATLSMITWRIPECVLI